MLVIYDLRIAHSILHRCWDSYFTECVNDQFSVHLLYTKEKIEKERFLCKNKNKDIKQLMKG